MVSIQELKGKRVTVLGLGRFGGGIAVARWLCEQGAHVLVTDRDTAESLADSVAQLAGLPIGFRLGEQRLEDFTSADLVVASPAVKPTNEFLLAARSANVPVTTEICLFVERCPTPIFGVTGTKGKSTTTEMLGRMLRTKGPCYVGGNIGKSLLADLPKMDSTSSVVLELSSYMLHYLAERAWSPRVAVITMLGDDHVEWHGDAEAYMAAKRSIVAHQRGGDVLVRRDDALAQTFAAQPGVNVRLYPSSMVPPFDLKLRGEHNQANVQAAFLAASAGGVRFAAAQDAVRDFAGLPHRLELVHEAGGVRFYNDSIATIPEAAIIACDAFAPGTVIQIVGGAHKEGLSWTAMCDHLDARCRRVLTIGAIGETLAQQCKNSDYVKTLAAAVSAAKTIARPGDVVLLSPGTASYDQYSNFQKRGEQFALLAKE